MIEKLKVFIKAKQQTILAIGLGASIAVIAWITLLSREHGNTRMFLEPLTAYRAVLAGDMDSAYEVVANILLFVPLGLFFFTGLTDCSWKKIAVMGAIASLTIESLQWFCYLGTFEVDDIINNTAGMLAGWWLTKSLLTNRWKSRESNCITTAVVATLVFTMMPLLPILQSRADESICCYE